MSLSSCRKVEADGKEAITALDRAFHLSVLREIGGVIRHDDVVAERMATSSAVSVLVVKGVGWFSHKFDSSTKR
jgi:hypothetical protein